MTHCPNCRSRNRTESTLLGSPVQQWLCLDCGTRYDEVGPDAGTTFKTYLNRLPDSEIPPFKLRVRSSVGFGVAYPGWYKPSEPDPPLPPEMQKFLDTL